MITKNVKITFIITINKAVKIAFIRYKKAQL